MINQWQGGMTGAQMERIEESDLTGVKRVDESWPVDSGGNKLSLPPTVAHAISGMEQGYITASRGQNDPPEDPAVSKKQYRAMQAAAHGRSTLGISKDVGQEFVKATGNPGSLPERKR